MIDENPWWKIAGWHTCPKCGESIEVREEFVGQEFKVECRNPGNPIHELRTPDGMWGPARSHL